MILPPQNGLEILGGVGGSQKPQNLSSNVWSSTEVGGGGVQRKNPFHGGGMDNYYFLKPHNKEKN